MPAPDRYLAYGSNLDPVQMRRRCPDSCVLGPAVAAGYALTFPVRSGGDWAGGVASIEPRADAEVHGVVYEVSEKDITALDRYEAVAEGMYVRGRVNVLRPGGEVIDAVTYFAVRGYNEPDAPSRRYLAAIVRGAAHHGLDPAYVESLRRITTND